jgi:hypothetical protein
VKAKEFTQEDVDKLAASIEHPESGETAVVGQPCPCCGRKVQKRGLSGAERQRRYRERKK